MQPGQIMWQPYEADFGHLPDFCVAGRDVWTARVPLVCFCIVETHHPDRVVRQFGLAQERPDHVVYDDRLHRIDLRGKVEKNWREEHGPYILTWDMRQQRLCHAPVQTGEMPRDHAYYRWYRPVTRKYVDRNSAKLDIMIESHLALLAMLPIGSREHNHVQRVLSSVVGLGGVPAPNVEANNGEANNGQGTESAATATPSTSAALLIPPTRGRRATASPSTSAARGRGRPATAIPSTSAARGHGQPATSSPSTSAARGRGRPATASPSTSASTGRGRRATTRGVVASPEIPAPIPHASPQPDVHPPSLDASPQFEVPPPMVDASPQPEVPSPTPPSEPSFDLGIPFHLTPPTHPETPSYPPISSSAPTLPIDPPRTEPMSMIPTPGLYTEHHYPPTSSSSDPLGPQVGIGTVQPDADVPDEHPPPQPSPPRGRPQRARRAPTCGTGGHKIGHKGSSMHDDEPKDDAPQPPPPPKQYTRKRKIVRYKDLLVDAYADLSDLLKSYGDVCGIVYCLERTTCDDLSAHLSKRGISCAGSSSDMIDGEQSSEFWNRDDDASGSDEDISDSDAPKLPDATEVVKSLAKSNLPSKSGLNEKIEFLQRAEERYYQNNFSNRKVSAISFDSSNFTLWGSGEWWMLLAAQSMAIGTVMVRWVSKYSDPIMATGWVA
ncbi:hypothetical protein SO802_029815 [Lithocarpus litseifolius]|uniref:Aminotransferase-like plant mobile domain-containing protein n=1 Tax=Lithocarpus litseifolius TaxID=425828 RepID=A0AAW2BW33_9ROSI